MNSEVHPKAVVALTGGIGCGKSTVAACFAARGVPVIDADEIAHALTGIGGRAIPALRSALGNDIIDEQGAMRRALVRERVFTDPGLKQRLESILHPLIGTALRAGINDAHGPYVLLVVPLLFEFLAYRDLVATTLVVDCPVADQIARVKRRSGLAETQIRAIMASQVPRCVRLQLADRVIVNTLPPALLDAEVARLHQAYLARFGHGL